MLLLSPSLPTHPPLFWLDFLSVDIPLPQLEILPEYPSGDLGRKKHPSLPGRKARAKDPQHPKILGSRTKESPTPPVATSWRRGRMAGTASAVMSAQLSAGCDVPKDSQHGSFALLRRRSRVPNRLRRPSHLAAPQKAAQRRVGREGLSTLCSLLSRSENPTRAIPPRMPHPKPTQSKPNHTKTQKKEKKFRNKVGKCDM
jgi:hypothetical protein